MRFICPSWGRIYSQSITLAEKIRKSEDDGFDDIIGVSRGALALTRVMSDLLENDKVMIARCEYYSDMGRTRKRPMITQTVQGDIKGKKVLLLDDVADTGESLIEIRKYLLKEKKPGKVTIATLYIKPWTKIIPDYYVSKTSAWIIFPWELLEAMKSITEKSGYQAVNGVGMPRKYLNRIRDLANSTAMKGR